MDEAESAGRTHQLLYSTHNLMVVMRSHGLHYNTHRPSHSRAEVRSTRSVEHGSKSKVRIVAGEHEVTSMAVDSVRVGLESQMGDAQQGGYIGVILC